MKIGFIGLGIMGRPMARNLLKAGHSVVVNGRHADVVSELVEAGATRADTAREVAEASEIVITMVQNSPQVKEAVLGPDGVLEGAHDGLVLVDMSSVAPLVSREIHDAVAAKGVRMLDAPVSGGEPKAVDGTLAIMVGGDRATFDEVTPVLQAMGSTVTYVGPIGAGNIAKLANQVVVAVNIAAVAEALALAKKAGVDPDAVYQAIRGGLAGSTVMDAKAPMMLDHTFKPGFRVALHIKDLTNALETSEGVEAPLPLASAVLEMMNGLREDGFDAEDHSALARHYEKLAGISLQREA